MALSEHGYSRLVAWLKVLLPLTALAILSTLFLLARSPDIERSIPFAEVDVEDLAREARVSNPDFSGVTPDGVAVSMTARSAQPDPQDDKMFIADGMEGLVTTTDGARLRMTSVTGRVDMRDGTVVLSGDVQVETSSGYAVRSEELLTRLDAGFSESPGPVDVMAPFGHLTAGTMSITRTDTPEGASSHLLVFSGGVDLIYDPGR